MVFFKLSDKKCNYACVIQYLKNLSGGVLELYILFLHYNYRFTAVYASIC